MHQREDLSALFFPLDRYLHFRKKKGPTLFLLDEIDLASGGSREAIAVPLHPCINGETRLTSVPWTTEMHHTGHDRHCRQRPGHDPMAAGKRLFEHTVYFYIHASLIILCVMPQHTMRSRWRDPVRDQIGIE